LAEEAALPVLEEAEASDLLQQQEVWEEAALPVLEEAEALGSEIDHPSPQAYRYSGSLFRQPRLISFLS